MDPLGFFDRCREKVDCNKTLNDIMILTSSFSQHGNVFTFVLLGRRMIVALGPKGSNLILGGKLSEVSAEEAYTVRTPSRPSLPRT